MPTYSAVKGVISTKKEQFEELSPVKKLAVIGVATLATGILIRYGWQKYSEKK